MQSRTEIIARQAHRYGHETIQLGMSPWRLTSILLAIMALTVLLFIWLCDYTKKARVLGQVVPSQGLTKVIALQAGVVNDLRVTEGQHVKAGDVLLQINSSKALVHGSLQKEVLTSIDERSANLEESKEVVHSMYRAKKREAKEKVRQLSAQASDLAKQKSLLEQRSKLANLALQRQQKLLEEGYVSAASVDEKRAELAMADSQLAALRSSVAEMAQQQASATSLLEQLPLSSQSERNSLNRDIAALAAERAHQESQREMRVIAPRDGIVTALQIKQGVTVNEQTVLLQLLPEGDSYQVELFVPSRDIGFVKKGMQVSLRYEAFPYQKFGVQTGRVLELTKTVIPARELSVSLPEREDYYRLLVHLPSQKINHANQSWDLQSGMKVEADVTLDTRPIWEWLFEPLLGLKKNQKLNSERMKS
ncbi:HlyD family secretion protein [Undibacterium sp. Dicai25W]|uniref:HlyD family secretion protein n=1 Tax=Undibacterium sp. Dicai25W TaxID=3413034 RepID=UPI003BF41F72